MDRSDCTLRGLPPSPHPTSVWPGPLGYERSPAGAAHAIDLGSGDPVVIMQGFGLQPWTYLALAELLAERCGVIIPALFAESGWPWWPEAVLDDLEATLDQLGIGPVSLIGHSFGGRWNSTSPSTTRSGSPSSSSSTRWRWPGSGPSPPRRSTRLPGVDGHPPGGHRLRHLVADPPPLPGSSRWWGFRSDRASRWPPWRLRHPLPRAVGRPRQPPSRSDGAAFARDWARLHRGARPQPRPGGPRLVYRHPSWRSSSSSVGLRALAPPLTECPSGGEDSAVRSSRPRWEAPSSADQAGREAAPGSVVTQVRRQRGSSGWLSPAPWRRPRLRPDPGADRDPEPASALRLLSGDGWLGNLVTGAPPTSGLQRPGGRPAAGLQPGRSLHRRPAPRWRLRAGPEDRRLTRVAPPS